MWPVPMMVLAAQPSLTGRATVANVEGAGADQTPVPLLLCQKWAIVPPTMPKADIATKTKTKVAPIEYRNPISKCQKKIANTTNAAT
jgi:hypothetical protein